MMPFKRPRFLARPRHQIALSERRLRWLVLLFYPRDFSLV